MQRIAIIGCGGSGKSTVANRLGALLGVPVHHLDQLYWKPGWIEISKPEWEAIQARLCNESTWIMDGNYGGTMNVRLAAADTVIFLDMPTGLCLWAVIRRFFKYRGGSRPDMSPECPERFSLQFLWWIWTYRRTRRPKILHTLERLDQNVVILNSRQAVDIFLSNINKSLTRAAV